MPSPWLWWPSGAFRRPTCPSDALDDALAADDDYRVARDLFHGLHERLRGHEVFFDIEAAVSQMVVVAVDVGFRVGRSTFGK